MEFVKRARNSGYYIRFFYISTDCPSINAARITKRYLQGGHAVPIEKIVDRYYRSIQQCVDIVPYVDRMDLFDNSRTGEKSWVRLFKFGPDRKLTEYEDTLPEWAQAVLSAARAVAEK